MAYRRPQPRSPPRNFKVNFDIEPSLEQASIDYIHNLIPKLGRTYTSTQELQVQVSNELCRHFKKSVGVSVVQKNEGQVPPMENFRVPVTFSFTMNDFVYRVWIHEHQVEFQQKPFIEKRPEGRVRQF